VIGRCRDIEGVWIEPVTAQVIMTLRDFAMSVPTTQVKITWTSILTLCLQSQNDGVDLNQ